MPLAAFDLDGTLVNQASAAREWTQEFVTRWKLPTDAADAIALALSGQGSKEAAFERIVRDWSVPTSATEVWAAYRSRMPELVTVTDADRQALAALRSVGWVIGIVTNGMADNQERKIWSTGLAGLVDGWVISSEAGVRKPEPQIFHILASRVGCPLRGWMIGDSLQHDVLGGVGVGLQTAWIASPDAGVPTGQDVFDIRASSAAVAVAEILSVAS